MTSQFKTPIRAYLCIPNFYKHYTTHVVQHFKKLLTQFNFFAGILSSHGVNFIVD